MAPLCDSSHHYSVFSPQAVAAPHNDEDDRLACHAVAWRQLNWTIIVLPCGTSVSFNADLVKKSVNLSAVLLGDSELQCNPVEGLILFFSEIKAIYLHNWRVKSMFKELNVLLLYYYHFSWLSLKSKPNTKVSCNEPLAYFLGFMMDIDSLKSSMTVMDFHHPYRRSSILL